MAEEKSYHHGNLREALLMAGLELLQEQGASGFSLRACAARAGVSHAAPAHHFGDMKALLSTIAAGGYLTLAQTMNTARKSAGTDAARAIEAIAAAYIGFAMGNSALFSLMMDGERTDGANTDLQDGIAALKAEIAAVAAPASRRTGPAGPHTPALMETFLWSMLQGLAQLAVAGRLEEGGAVSRQASDLIRTVSTLMLEG